MQKPIDRRYAPKPVNHNGVMKSSTQLTADAKSGQHNNWSADNRSDGGCLRCWRNQTAAEKCYLCVIFVLLALLILVIFTFIFLILEDDLGGIISKKEAKSPTICLSRECVRVSANILDRIDPAVDPCKDFYQFSCGNFARNNPVPDDHYMKNLLQMIQDEIYLEMKSYLEIEIGDNDTKAVQQIKLLYNSCMNETNSNNHNKSMTALITLFEQIGGQWPLIRGQIDESREYDLEYRLSSLMQYQVKPFFQLYIEPEQSNKSGNYAIHLFSGSTFLEPNYLLNSDNRFEVTEEIRSYIELQREVADIVSKYSDNRSQIDSKSLTDEIMEMIRLESDLSKITKEVMNDSNYSINLENVEELLIDNETNNSLSNGSNAHNMFSKLSIEELQQSFKSINWKKLFSLLLGASGVETNEILINSKDYLNELMKLIDSYSVTTIDNYLCWTFIARYLPYLGPQFRRLYSEFRTKVPEVSVETTDPNGSSRIFLSRWKECVHVVSEGLDVPSIALYLNHKSGSLDAMVAQINKLIDQMKVAFNSIIDSQLWIDSQELKNNFKERVNSIKSKIGVPKMLLNATQVDALYEKLDIDSDDVLIANIFKVAKHQVMLELAKLSRLADPEEEWIIQPLVANAYYDPINNNIIMPPGILRFPLFSWERPRYLDLSTVGIVIGHEIAHSMGSDSRKFMKYPNGTNWWTSDATKAFKEKANCFANQYSQYLIETTDEYLNGNHTLEENICDFAALQQSFTAFKLDSRDHFVQLPGLSNYSSAQLFFIQYAQIWCEVVSDEGHRKSLHDDHSPGRYRANGVLANSRQFSKAFNCPEDCAMNPKEKCDLWVSDQW